MTDALLRMEGIFKSFPGVRALDDVDLTVRSGSVHALMGENGAGKSTLMKCLFGVYGMDKGRILLEGKEISFSSPKDALEAGVAMVHQELNQAGTRSVSDNMWLGRFIKPIKFLPFTSDGRMIAETERIFKRFKLDIDPTARIDSLSISKRQMVEIAKAISYNAKIIVFDEPTSSLNAEEAEKLFDIIRMLRGEGCGIIYISHKMEEILRISDDVTVMRDGKRVATKEASSLSTDEIIRLMVGRELTQRYPKRKGKKSGELLRIEDLSSTYNKLREVSFSLGRGEILGVSGLDGAGRSELLENIFGLSSRKSGRIYLNGREIKNKSPKESIKNGFALVTEDRRASGIFGILGITENTVISSLKDHSRLGFLSSAKMRDATSTYIKALRIKTPSEKTKIRLLSGGNQQKVIFARWMLTKPTVLLLDEPTRGIDVLAKYEIYELILKLADEGHGVILVSSEMPELLGLCDRILVMSGGRAAGIVERGASSEEILELCTKFV